MTRKMLTATLVVAALLLSVLSLGAFTSDAEAQGHPLCPYNQTISIGHGYGGFSHPCAPAIAYPGPFTNMPPSPKGPYGWGSLTPVVGVPADGGDGAAGGETPGTGGGGLAHTGSESAVLGYIGTGLIAFGAVALGSRRKFFQGTLD